MTLYFINMILLPALIVKALICYTCQFEVVKGIVHTKMKSHSLATHHCVNGGLDAFSEPLLQIKKGVIQLSTGCTIQI